MSIVLDKFIRVFFLSAILWAQFLNPIEAMQDEESELAATASVQVPSSTSQLAPQASEDESSEGTDSDDNKFINHLKIGLLQEGKTRADALAEGGDRLLGPIRLREGILLYVNQQPIKPPLWLNACLSDVDKEASQEIIERIKPAEGLQVIGGLGFLEQEGRTFVLYFGNGRYFLKDGVCEDRFGLKTVLNAMDPEKIKSLGSKLLSANTRHTHTKFDFALPAQRFPQEGFLASISAKKTGADYLISFTGAQVTLNKWIPIKDIPSTCAELFGFFRKDINPAWAWVDDLQPIDSDNPICVRLHEQLFDALRGKKRPWQLTKPIWDSIPGEDEPVAKYQFGKQSDQTLEGILDVLREHIEDYLKRDSKQPLKPAGLVKHLKRQVVYGYNDAGNEVAKWNAYTAIAFEANVKNGTEDATYVLNGGEWFKVDAAKNEDTSRFIDKLELKELKLPNIRIKESPPLKKQGSMKKQKPELEEEDDYIRRVVERSRGQFFLMDQREISATKDSRDLVEVCDILSQNKQLIHIKRGTHSSTLSHLFSQGEISGKSLMDRSFREKARKKFVRAQLSDRCRKAHAEVFPDADHKEVSKLFKTLNEALNTAFKEGQEDDRDALLSICAKVLGEKVITPARRKEFSDGLAEDRKIIELLIPDEFDPHEFTVVYAFTSSTAIVSKALSYFSRTNLEKRAKILQELGYTVKVKIIQEGNQKKLSEFSDFASQVPTPASRLGSLMAAAAASAIAPSDPASDMFVTSDEDEGKSCRHKRQRSSSSDEREGESSGSESFSAAANTTRAPQPRDTRRDDLGSPKSKKKCKGKGKAAASPRSSTPVVSQEDETDEDMAMAIADSMRVTPQDGAATSASAAERESEGIL